ncbi:hypothetical protein [Propionivibrio limicola]|nr:hypothetical protein [Propionivibrio limicola]
MRTASIQPLKLLLTVISGSLILAACSTPSGGGMGGMGGAGGGMGRF